MRKIFLWFYNYKFSDIVLIVFFTCITLFVSFIKAFSISFQFSNLSYFTTFPQFSLYPIISTKKKGKFAGFTHTECCPDFFSLPLGWFIYVIISKTHKLSIFVFRMYVQHECIWKKNILLLYVCVCPK